jgi:uncharacterized protein YcgI (DUF1989 family)
MPAIRQSDRLVVSDAVIPPREYLALKLERDQVLRIVDVAGQQVTDLVCFARDDLSERLSTNNSMLIQRSWRLTTGHALFSDEGNEMLTTVDDTNGIHHASGGCCNVAATSGGTVGGAAVATSTIWRSPWPRTGSASRRFRVPSARS